jgi:hypothetical protein
MSDLKELERHVCWLEDQVSQATAVGDRLDQIDGRLEAMNEILENYASELGRLADANSRLTDSFNRAADVINRNSDILKQLVEVLATPRPQPSMGDVFGAVFKATEPKQPAAKTRPRKPKLSVVPTKDGDAGPGAST